MSSRDWQLRVQDILNAISSIQESTANMTFEEFVAEEIIVKAVLYLTFRNQEINFLAEI